MNINLTLFGQMISFALFVWITMKFIWPPILKAIEERQKKINEGLAAAERGHHELDIAQENITQQLRESKVQADELIDRANIRANQIVEEARHQAETERAHLKSLTDAEIRHEVKKAKQELQLQLADLIVKGAERVIKEKLDAKGHDDFLKKIIKEIE